MTEGSAGAHYINGGAAGRCSAGCIDHQRSGTGAGDYAGLKLPVTPDGSPDTPKFTAELNPFTGITVTVYETLPPAATV